ncbi:DUF3243 domain-containing protein [Effusibacillus consociatus]|uniref:DUF3243 domain-containing protein n=1 Tax=Effusibacillus consociatus TaxID=1117041 RepID=A0ABV9Q0K8_9BACL
MSVLDNFDRWKEFLGDRVQQAQEAGMSNQQIEEVAVRLGEYLSNKVDPENPQERLLKQMWESSPSPDDKHAMARIMMNLVTKH